MQLLRCPFIPRHKPTTSAALFNLNFCLFFLQFFIITASYSLTCKPHGRFFSWLNMFGDRCFANKVLPLPFIRRHKPTTPAALFYLIFCLFFVQFFTITADSSATFDCLSRTRSFRCRFYGGSLLLLKSTTCVLSVVSFVDCLLWTRLVVSCLHGGSAQSPQGETDVSFSVSR